MKPFSQQDLVKDISQKFNKVLKIVDADYFKLNCIQIVNVSSFSRIVNERMPGRVVNVSIGNESFCSFSIRGTLITSDGGISMHEKPQML